MEKETAPGSSAPHAETCLCRDIGLHLATLFGLQSEGARQHLRNARIEVLKALRALINERIEYLSRTEQQGTKVTVE